MKIAIDIPDNEIPKRQEIISIGIHFIDGKVCECTYPFEELIDNAPTVEQPQGDLISREALKEHKFPIPLIGDYQQGWNDAIDVIIDNAPTVVANNAITEPTGEWIPVSERLPEEKINPYTTDFDEVLCTTDRGEVLAFKFGTPILHHEPHFWLGGAIMDDHVIAWQYKPELYKNGGEKE